MLFRFLVNNFLVTAGMFAFFALVDSVSTYNLTARFYTVFGFAMLYVAMLFVHGLIVFGGNRKKE